MKFVINGDEESGSVGHLVQELKVDANIDLSADEEYEDLRAEFLAYREALTNLKSRRYFYSWKKWTTRTGDGTCNVLGTWRSLRSHSTVSKLYFCYWSVWM
ncbi:unnamed protein product [Leptidea sinapis]|uniref:Uncharacterized protein n=1 Tax=Leptidea sinapis TaxID=189913 RepID=A0A5E4Q2S7_9NEOP|nr:unnamed protein product [Leptidea sinapis]